MRQGHPLMSTKGGTVKKYRSSQINGAPGLQHGKKSVFCLRCYSLQNGVTLHCAGDTKPVTVTEKVKGRLCKEERVQN